MSQRPRPNKRNGMPSRPLLMLHPPALRNCEEFRAGFDG